MSARADLAHVDAYGRSCFFDAVAAPTSDVLHYFIQQNICNCGVRSGAGLLAVDRHGVTLLHHAAHHGRAPAVKQLLQLKWCDAQVNRLRPDFLCPTPLLAAAACMTAPREEVLACVEALVEARGNLKLCGGVGTGDSGMIEERKWGGATPLLEAA